MEYRRLGASALRISCVGLGTMTMGGMVGEKASLRQLDRALDGGINFVDTAEQYASPPTDRSYGRSEAIIGKWLRTKPRDSVVLASKISGPAEFGYPQPHIRGGYTAFDRHHLIRAVDGSLKRLRTDYLDLYQLHWPDRRTPIVDQLEAIERLINAGKVRYFGANVETAWGLTKFATLADERGLPRVASIQTGYNLLQRDVDVATAEVCTIENIGFLAFSALAMGVLTGKYSGGRFPRARGWPRTRSTASVGGTAPPTCWRRPTNTSRSRATPESAPSISRSAGCWAGRSSPRRFPPPPNRPHLETLLKAAEVRLGDDVRSRIDAVHAESRLELNP